MNIFLSGGLFCLVIAIISNTSALDANQRMVTKVLSLNQRYCFSIDPVAACKHGSKGATSKSELVKFHCLPSNSTTTRSLVDEAHKGKVLTEFSKKPVTYSEYFPLPTSCKAN